ncbi:putative copia-like polyprotein, partial [Tanacetum coccineum]
SRTIGNKKYLLIINENQVFEKLPMLHSGLHYTHINVPQANMAVKEKYCDHGIFSLWRDRLGHPGSTMMKRIVKNIHGHPLKVQKFSKMDKVPLCTSCSLGKLIVRPSPLKIKNESPMFLERIQGDICGPIHPPCGPFRYFLILIDAFSRWSHVSLLSTRNVAFAKNFAQIIKLRAHFLDYTVIRVRLDNAGEFTSHDFNDYCMSVGILPDAFTDTKRVTKSHIPVANASARVEKPNKQVGDNIAQESQKLLKRGRPIGSKDKNPRKRKGTEKNSGHDDNVLNETQDIKTSPKEEMNDINKEMSINYSQTHILWDRNEIGDIDEIFSYSVASDIMSGDDDPEPKSIINCQI